MEFSITCRRIAVVVLAGTTALLGGCVATSANRIYVDFTQRDFISSDSGAKKAAESGVDRENMLATRAWGEFMRGHYQRALAQFRDLREEYPATWDGNLGKAWILIKQGDLEGGEHWAELAHDWINVWQYAQENDIQGWLAMNRGDLETARAKFEPEDSLLFHEDYFYYNILDEVRAMWASAPEVSLGWLAVKNNDFEKARFHFQRGLERDPHCYLCRDGLARMAIIRNDYRQALSETMAGIKLVRHAESLAGLLDSILAELDQPGLAVATYKDLAAFHAADPMYPTRLGYAYLTEGQVVAAKNQFRDVLKRWPTDVEGTAGARAGLIRAGQSYASNSALDLAWADYHAGKYELAADAFKVLRARFHKLDSPLADDGLGWSLLGLGRAADAAQAFRDALGVDADYAYSQNGLAAAEIAQDPAYGPIWAEIAAGRLKQAKVLAEAAAPTAVDWPRRASLAWIALLSGDAQTAGQMFQKVLEVAPYAWPARTGLGLSLVQSGQVDNGLIAMQQSFYQNPSQEDAAYLRAADALIKQGRPFAARDILLIAGQTQVKGPIALKLARLAWDADDAVGARDWLALAANTVPAQVAAMVDPTDVPVERIDRVESERIKLPERYLGVVRHALGWGYYFAGDARLAQHYFEKAEAQLPDNDEVKHGIAFASYRQGDIRGAINRLKPLAGAEYVIAEEVAIPGTGSVAEILYDAQSTLAWSYFRNRDWAAAETEFTHASRRHPDWVDVWSGLGHARAAQGDNSGAREAFRKALAIQPDYPDALRALAEMSRAS
ncbi:MAG: tetratricopeptide repeat protein [Gammaproteobacteria bacterium]|nr:tetratricopeptide repeat protein [Gammaproteobacteria bacterium]MCP5137967.1 tetratricopeptide repeat protein [Gammaproteobacteria bacterium]